MFIFGTKNNNIEFQKPASWKSIKTISENPEHYEAKKPIKKIKPRLEMFLTNFEGSKKKKKIYFEKQHKQQQQKMELALGRKKEL